MRPAQVWQGVGVIVLGGLLAVGCWYAVRSSWLAGRLVSRQDQLRRLVRLPPANQRRYRSGLRAALVAGLVFGGLIVVLGVVTLARGFTGARLT